MLTDLLDLLTPSQMFQMLNHFGAYRLPVTRANVRGYMRRVLNMPTFP